MDVECSGDFERAERIVRAAFSDAWWGPRVASAWTVVRHAAKFDAMARKSRGKVQQRADDKALDWRSADVMDLGDDPLGLGGT